MNQRQGVRGRTDFPVTLAGILADIEARGIELSSSGIILDRGRELLEEAMPWLLRLSIRLPERRRPIQALARHVRCFGSQQVLRFVSLSDADRLNLAEHLDIVQRRGTRLA